MSKKRDRELKKRAGRLFEIFGAERRLTWDVIEFGGSGPQRLYDMLLASDALAVKADDEPDWLVVLPAEVFIKLVRGEIGPMSQEHSRAEADITEE